MDFDLDRPRPVKIPSGVESIVMTLLGLMLLTALCLCCGVLA